ncbi:hypothetical protein C8R44DRAFT_882736 [Mycena epipterygia]|nr:hypothetical protein C8R44DRAFT_882736 [Mycena epipterygia]
MHLPCTHIPVDPPHAHVPVHLPCARVSTHLPCTHVPIHAPIPTSLYIGSMPTSPQHSGVHVVSPRLPLCHHSWTPALSSSPSPLPLSLACHPTAPAFAVHSAVVVGCTVQWHVLVLYHTFAALFPLPLLCTVLVSTSHLPPSASTITGAGKTRTQWCASPAHPLCTCSHPSHASTLHIPPHTSATAPLAHPSRHPLPVPAHAPPSLLATPYVHCATSHGRRLPTLAHDSTTTVHPSELAPAGTALGHPYTVYHGSSTCLDALLRLPSSPQPLPHVANACT